MKNSSLFTDDREMGQEKGSYLGDFSLWKSALREHRPHAYLLAAIITLAAFYFKTLFVFTDTLTAPFLLLSFAVFFSTFIGGLGPGLLSTALTIALIEYVTPPGENLGFAEQYLLYAAFLVQSLLIVYFVSRQEEVIHERMEMGQRKDAFISATSHELKTPVTSLKMYTELLIRHLSYERNRHIDLAEQISAQTEKLIRIINELLDITKLDRGELAFEQVPINLAVLVEKTVADHTCLSDRHNFLVESAGPMVVSGNYTKLEYALSNLLTNAVKYSPDGCDIMVRLEKDHDEAVVSVTDKGIGISEEDQKHVLERFYRASGVSEETFPGMGIGLYIASEIVKLHGGRLWIKSKKGKGSTFSFSLPLLKTVGQGGKRVLGTSFHHRQLSM